MSALIQPGLFQLYSHWPIDPSPPFLVFFKFMKTHLTNRPIALISKSLLSLKSESDSKNIDAKTLTKLAEQVLADPIAMRRLSERVIAIMTLDLQQQCERGNQNRQW